MMRHTALLCSMILITIPYFSTFRKPGYQRIVLQKQLEKMDLIASNITYDIKIDELNKKVGRDVWGNNQFTYVFPEKNIIDEYLGEFNGKSAVVVSKGENGVLEGDYSNVENDLLAFTNDDIYLVVSFIDGEKSSVEVIYNDDIYCKPTRFEYHLTVIPDRITIIKNKVKSQNNHEE